MTNFVTIEIDLDSIITAKDKADALYKAVKEDVLGQEQRGRRTYGRRSLTS